MAKRQKKDSVVEQAVLEAVSTGKKRTSLTRFACGCVGAELGRKAKAFVRFAEARSHPVEDELDKKCPECK